MPKVATFAQYQRKVGPTLPQAIAWFDLCDRLPVAIAVHPDLSRSNGRHQVNVMRRKLAREIDNAILIGDRNKGAGYGFYIRHLAFLFMSHSGSNLAFLLSSLRLKRHL